VCFGEARRGVNTARHGGAELGWVGLGFGGYCKYADGMRDVVQWTDAYEDEDEDEYLLTLA